jgi:hypothetical protein
MPLNRLKGATRVVLLGVGSDLRGDDAAGMMAAERLSHTPKLNVLLGGTAPENLTGEIKKLKPSHLLIVDAAEMKAEAGTIRLLTPEEIGGFSFSTHALPLKAGRHPFWRASSPGSKTSGPGADRSATCCPVRRRSCTR